MGIGGSENHAFSVLVGNLYASDDTCFASVVCALGKLRIDKPYIHVGVQSKCRFFMANPFTFKGIAKTITLLDFGLLRL